MQEKKIIGMVNKKYILEYSHSTGEVSVLLNGTQLISIPVFKSQFLDPQDVVDEVVCSKEFSRLIHENK
jgi:hypothetical protein